MAPRRDLRPELDAKAAPVVAVGLAGGLHHPDPRIGEAEQALERRPVVGASRPLAGGAAGRRVAEGQRAGIGAEGARRRSSTRDRAVRACGRSHPSGGRGTGSSGSTDAANGQHVHAVADQGLAVDEPLPRERHADEQIPLPCSGGEGTRDRRRAAWSRACSPQAAPTRCSPASKDRIEVDVQRLGVEAPACPRAGDRPADPAAAAHPAAVPPRTVRSSGSPLCFLEDCGVLRHLHGRRQIQRDDPTRPPSRTRRDPRGSPRPTSRRRRYGAR